MKCDETRPDCIRCSKFGVQCEGYLDRHKQVIVPASRIILPKPITPSASEAFHPAPTYTLNIGARILDEREYRYLRIYHDDTANQLKGLFQTSLWHHLIPQMSENEPYIRDAIIGLGALRFGRFKDDTTESTQVAHLSSTTSDYSYALIQYGKALRGVNAAISRGEHDINKILVACILMFCFETMSGKPASAIANATSGMMLLCQWIQTHSNRCAEFFLSNSWQEQSTDEDLMIALGGLDMQILIFLDSRPEPVHLFMVEEANKIIPHMPTTFVDLKAARKFWSLIMRRNFHFIKIAMIRAGVHEVAGQWRYGSEAPWEDCLDILPGGNIFSAPRDPPMNLIPEMEVYQEDTRRFSAACEAIFQGVDSSGCDEDRLLVALLRTHILMSKILLTAAFFQQESQWDIFFPEFREMISLCEYIHPRVVSRGTFTFELGIVMVFWVTACRCRELVTRDKAIAMMHIAEFREGFYDTSVSYVYGKVTRDAEETGRNEDGELPEHKRLFPVCAYVDVVGRRMILGHVKKGLEGTQFSEIYHQW